MVTATLRAGTLMVGLALAACQASGVPATQHRPATPSVPTAEPASRAPDLDALRVSPDGWRTDFTKASVNLGDFLGGGPPKDGIPALDNPSFEPIEAARTWLSERSPVIALELGGRARAYPLAILTWHEIVNDTLGGVPVIVTFCPLCNTALVFERELDGAVYDFGTTGNLRYSDLVMYDRQTESWWQQATGEAVVGELTGTRLPFVPAQIVSLAAFAEAYPNGDVLSRDTGIERAYGRNPYVGYDEVDSKPFLFDGVVDGRLSPKERVVTVGEGADATAFPFSELRKVGVATGAVNGAGIVVFWAPGVASALGPGEIDEGDDVGATGVFLTEFNGQQLSFRRLGGEGTVISDAETGSTWSVTGRATAGPLAGAQLEPVPHGNHFWFAWAAFSPDTTIWTAP